MAKKPQDRLTKLVREVERDLQKTAKQLRKAGTDVATQTGRPTNQYNNHANESHIMVEG